MAQYISQYISNLIDDGYVEDRILANFPGKLGYDLEELREIHFKEVPTVTELIEKEDTEGRHIFESIAQIMPVSYTHLDVYKRQTLSWTLTTIQKTHVWLPSVVWSSF